jgi:predicted dehydrogenase
MTAKLRVGIIGAGAIAHTHAEALRVAAGTQLVGVADVDARAADAFAAQFGVPAFDRHERLAREARLDLAILCTPPSTHLPISLDLLAARVAVLCEKPLALDVRSAELILNAAEKHGAAFTMASKFRFVRDVERAREMIVGGELGEVVLLENAFTSRVDMSARWNSDPRVSGGGVLIDNGTHSVDVIRFLLGPIAEVQAIEGKRVQPLAVEDSAVLFLRAQSGATATVDLSWSINKELEDFIAIHGSHGSVRVGWKRSRAKLGGAASWSDFGTGYDKLACFVQQLDNVTRAIAGGEPMRVSPLDALASVHVIEAAYRSMRASQWVRVDSESQ